VVEIPKHCKGPPCSPKKKKGGPRKSLEGGGVISNPEGVEEGFGEKTSSTEIKVDAVGLKVKLGVVKRKKRGRV